MIKNVLKFLGIVTLLFILISETCSANIQNKKSLNINENNQITKIISASNEHTKKEDSINNKISQNIKNKIVSNNFDMNDGIYFTEKYKDKTNYFPNGYKEHVFNKYLDSIELCKAFLQLKDSGAYLKKQYLLGLDKSLKENFEKLDSKDVCMGDFYMNEKNFVAVNAIYSKEYNKVADVYELIWDNYGFRQMSYYQSYKTDYKPKEGDLMQIRIYVHDNYEINPNNILKNTQVNVELENNIITARVGNTNVFSSSKAEVYFVDNSKYELAFAQSSDYPSYKFKDGTKLSEMGNYISYRDSKTDKKTLVTTYAPLKTRNLRNDEYKVSSDFRQFTFYKGDQIGGFPYAYSITLDLVVKRKK